MQTKGRKPLKANKRWLWGAIAPCLIFLLLAVCPVPVFAEDENDSESSGMDFIDVISWPFANIVQPVFSVAVYPFSAPVKYFFDNNVPETAVELITFGEQENILVYPTMCLKPGSSTMIGVMYRHRGLVLNKDYLVLAPEYYANGDVLLDARYSKQQFLGKNIFGSVRIKKYMDRDAGFILPESKNGFTQPDSSVHINGTLGFPLFGTNSNWSIGLRTGYEWKNASEPEQSSDSLLVDENYSMGNRGIYQDFDQVPLGFTVAFDNLDFPYAPTSGNRFSFSGTYVFVLGYNTLDDGANHNFLKTETVLQHYLYLGHAPKYHLSASEAREKRLKYLDFSLDNTLRSWHPSNMANTLLERRVLAMQFRMVNLWEAERGEAPYSAFPSMGTRFPMRGYSSAWAAHHVMGISGEYRWPIDRYVDGVVFDEYGFLSRTITGWTSDKFYNSWGFGIRARKPDMYWFRVQLGFHGLQGVNLIMTIAPEYS